MVVTREALRCAGGRPTKILVVVNTTARRGAELEGADLSLELSRAGIDARIVALTVATGPSDVDIPSLGTSPRSLSTLRSLRTAAGDADLVIAYGSSTLPACAMALAGSGVPFIYRSIGDPSDWVRGDLHRRRTRLLFRRASFVVALWSKAAHDIESMYSVASSRMAIIPNARSDARFAPPSPAERSRAREFWGVSDDRPVVAILGALAPEKQIDQAIRAMDLLPHCVLLVAGDGPERHYLQSLSNEAPSRNVTLVGAVRDPLSILHAADVALLTSRTEGMPGVVIEAGLCAVPSVAPAVGTLPAMIVDGVSGGILASTDPVTVAATVRAVLDDAGPMGSEALRRMRSDYTWGSALGKWIDVISAVLDGGRR